MRHSAHLKRSAEILLQCTESSAGWRAAKTAQYRPRVQVKHWQHGAALPDSCCDPHKQACGLVCCCLQGRHWFKLTLHAGDSACQNLFKPTYIDDRPELVDLLL